MSTGIVPPVARDDDQARAILDAASRLLAEEGPAGLTVRRIATEAGCSTMGVYSRFGGKDGVVDRLFAEGFEWLRDAMVAAPVTDDPVADLLDCGRAYRASALAHATHYLVMFAGVVPGFVPTEESMTLAEATFAVLVERVQRCIDTGRFRGDPAEIGQMLWAANHGNLMLELVGINPGDVDPAQRYERALVVMADGLLAEAATPTRRA